MRREIDKPAFSAERVKSAASGWKGLVSGPGTDRVVVEWNVITGPCVFIYPAAKRSAGVNLLADLGVKQSDERWADFLEFEYVPQVVDALRAEGHKPQVICADLKPIQTMRTRRRAIEQAGREKTGVAAHH